MPDRIIFALAAVLLAAPVAAAAATIADTRNPGAIERFPGRHAGLPFSAAIRIGDTVVVSGAIGLGADGKLPADFRTQATNAMQNVQSELALAGATMADVYRCEVSLADIGDWPAFNPVYASFFEPGQYPVRTATGGAVLVLHAAVEVSCDAWHERPKA